MTISYRSVSSASQTGLTSVVHRQPATLESTDIILSVIANKYPPNGPGTPTGFTQLAQVTVGDSGAAGADVGDIFITAYTKTSDGTEDGATETVNVTSGNTVIQRAVAYSRSGGSGWTVAYAFGEQGTASNDWSFNTGALDLAAGDIVVAFIGKPSDLDLTHSSIALSVSGVTFGTPTTRAGPSSTTNGDDISLHTVEIPVNSGSANAAIAFSMTCSGSAGTSAGGVLLVRLRETGGAPVDVNFSGTIPRRVGKEDTAITSIDASTYFAGTYTPFTYSIQSGSLPTGVTLNSSTGVISGTPTVAGTFNGIIVRATDSNSSTADSNAFGISLEQNVTSDYGYYAIAATGNDTMTHTTVSHSFWHDGFWWTLLRPSGVWALYKETGNIPGSPGGTVDWAGTAHLGSLGTLTQASIIVNPANNKAYTINFADGAATVAFKELTYSAGSWSIGTTFNLTNSAGVGLGTASTFSNHSKLSLGLDPNGVPYVFAGNKGVGTSATNGCHIAWPDNPASLGGTWSFKTIDTAPANEADNSGRFAGVFNQGGTNYIVVCYTDHTNQKVKMAYHPVETTMSNYSTGWTIVDINTTVAVDNHVWAGVMNYAGEQVVITLIKDGDLVGAGYIYLMTSKLGATLTWEHKFHRVTNGPADLGGLDEYPSRPVAIIDQSSGFVCVLYHVNDSHPYAWVGYKSATMGALLAAANENSVFDVTAPRNATPLINDATLDAAWNVKTPAHPVTPAMGGYAPVLCAIAANSTTGDSVWWNKIDIVPANRLPPGATGTRSQVLPFSASQTRFR